MANTPFTRFFASPLKAAVLAAGLAAMSLVGLTAPAAAQGLFDPVVRVNDSVITKFELDQRARMNQLFRSPDDPYEAARKALIDERLQLQAAKQIGVSIEEEAVQDGMAEFAARANMTAEEFLRALEGAGVAEESFRAFVVAGLSWREVVQARFVPRVNITAEDIDRARAATGGAASVRVLLSEIIMPAPPQQAEQVMQRASELSQITTLPEFASAARRYSATATAGRGGRMDWMPITQLPPQLRPIILGLAPGEVTQPLPLQGAVALFQLRDIEEVAVAAPDYAAIEYAAYYIAGGRTEAALKQAAKIKGEVDTCDDLYGVAKGQPDTVLDRGAKAPGDIPQDIAIELAKLDPGEVSTQLTRADGQTLVFLMLCGRTPKIEATGEGEDGTATGPTDEEILSQLRGKRVEAYASGYLSQLRSEARITEF